MTPNDCGSESTGRRGSRRFMPSDFILADQFNGREILEELMRSLDSELAITSFANPYEVLHYAGRQAPDLILTDCRMPDLDGIEFIRRLRAIPNFSDIR
jgi:two-component system, response regulator RpfG